MIQMKVDKTNSNRMTNRGQKINKEACKMKQVPQTKNAYRDTLERIYKAGQEIT